MSSGDSERMRVFRQRAKMAAMVGHAFFDCPRSVQLQIVAAMLENCKNQASRNDLLIAAAQLGLLGTPELKLEAEALLAVEQTLREKRRIGAEKSRHMKEAARRAEEEWVKVNGQ